MHPLTEAIVSVLGPRLKAIESRLVELEGRGMVTAEDVRPLVVAEVTSAVNAAVKAIPVPRDGKDGEPGRDASQIDILPSLDDDRCYARGTHASYRGGVIRAARTTDYLDSLKAGETIEHKGWHVLINGIANETEEQVDERTWVRKTVYTDGRVWERAYKLPVVIDRGVFRHDVKYERGDGVTCGGSFWIACKDAPTGKPGDNESGWRLAVKKGRDGKDK